MVADPAGVGALRLYGRLIGASVRSQMQYRADFILATMGVFLITGIEVIGIWALFARFGQLQGWRLAEVAMIYGVVNVTFALADMLATGFDTMAQQIRAGDFDRVLLRPRTTVLQQFGRELTLRRLGRLAQGAIVFAWAASHVNLDWDPARVALLLFTIAAGACLFIGLIILQATAAFWTVEALEVFNAFTYGGVFAAQYPLTIYAPWFRKFFTAVVPLALVTYFPMVAILGRDDPLGMTRTMQYLSPLAGVAFFTLSLLVWRIGIRKYTSTGS